MLSAMRLLVVGASVFLGRNIVQEAVRRGWAVTGTYRMSGDFVRFAKRVGFSALRYDTLRQVAPWDSDVCVYLAGNSNHIASAQDPLADLRNNAEGLLRFLRSFQGGLVFMSSAAVYEGHRGLVGPATCLRPRLPYAVSKLACEGYLDYFATKGTLEWKTVLRLYYAYAPHDRPTRFIPRLLQAAEWPEREFRITAPRGSLVDPMYVRDVVDAAL